MSDSSEFSRIDEKVLSLQHRARNDRQLIQLLDAELEIMRLELERLKTKAFTTLGVLAIVLSALAWFFEQKIQNCHESTFYCSDLDNFSVVRKLRFTAFQRRQARQNPTSKSSIRGHFLLKKHTAYWTSFFTFS